MRNRERQQAVETLSDSQALLAGIVNSAMDAIISVDSQHRIVLFNAAAEKMFRCSAATAMGQVLDRFIPLRSVEQHRQHLKKFGDTGITSRSMGLLSEVTGLRADGEEFPIEAAISQMELTGQKIFTVILRDITERKRAEEALREELNQAVLNSLPANIAVLASDGRIIAVNEAWRRFARQNSDASMDMSSVAVGANYFGFCHSCQEDAKAFAEARWVEQGIREVIEGKRDNFLYEYPCHSPTQERWFLMNASPLSRRRGGAVIAHLNISERKLAEKASREASEFNRQVIAGAHEGILVLDRELRYRIFNPCMEEITTWRAETVLGRTVEEMLPAPEATAIVARLRRALAGETVLSGDQFMPQAEDHPARWFTSKSAPLFNSDGEITGVIVTVHNITERKQAEEALQESEKRFREISESLPQLIWTCTPQGLCDYLSPQWVAYTGIAESEQLGMGWLQQVHPDDREPTMTTWKATAEAGELFEVEFRIRRYDGVYRWFKGRGVPLRDGQGNAVKWFGTNTDIEEQKQSEMIVTEWKNRYEATINASGQILYDWDPNTNEVTFGGNFQHVLGYSKEEMAGGLAHWAELIHPEDVAAFHQEIERVLQSGESFHLEYRARRKDGAYIFVDDHGYFFRDGQGAIARMVGFVRDITKRRQAETALQESEDRYRDLVEHSHDLICTHDLAGRILSVNQTAVKVLGYDRAELLNMNICEFLPTEFRHQFNDYIAELRSNGRATGVMIVQTRLGENRVWEYSNTLRTQGVAAPIVRGIAHDVTERKLAEAALKRSEERFRALTENTTDLIAILDADATFHYISPSLYHILGYTAEEWLGKNAFDFIHPEDAQAAAEALHKGIQHEDTGEPLEFRVRHQNGSWRVIKATDTNLLDNKAVAGIVINARDVTDRVRSQEALRKAEEKYRSIFENAVEGIFQYTPDGRFIAVNPALARILGYDSPEELMASRTDIKTQHYVDANCRLELQQRLAEKGVVLGFECEIFRKNMSRIWCVENIRTILDESGAVAYYEGSIENITERKHLEEQLRQAQRMEAVGQLAGGIAHDFNNLLTAINGYSELTMMQLQAEDPLRHSIAEIHKAGERAAALTRQLLAFSRKQVLQPKTLDLNLLVTEMEKMLRRLIGEDIDLQTILNPQLGSIKADPGQIEQVIMNLAVNARDAMAKGGKLTIETENVYLDEEFAEQHIAVTHGHYVMLSVSDTGSGMDEQTRVRIFEPFFTTKEMGKGTGLGLSTVYGIIRQSGGNVWVYSEVGRGTTFKVYLPRFDEGAQDYQHKAEAQDALYGIETILLTEDEEAVRQLSSRVLKMYGYQVLEAANGEAALQLCERYDKPIHLLISDVIMPGMNGCDLADQLSHLRPGMKMLLMSGYTNNAIINQRVFDEGVNFIQKPFTPNTLAHKVREVLDKPKAIVKRQDGQP